MEIEKEIAHNRYEILILRAALSLFASELGISIDRQREIFEDADEIASVEIVKSFPDTVVLNKDNPKILGALKKLTMLREKKPK